MSVLIETYWNVNSDSPYASAVALRINRNILECKDSHQSMEGPKRRLVLIETYWNVKAPQGRTLLRKITVLIETYWNVNKFGLAFASSSFVY